MLVPPLPKTMLPVVSESTTLAAVNAPAVTPVELVTVTVFNALVWPTLVRVIPPVDSKVRFLLPLTLAKVIVPTAFKLTSLVSVVARLSRVIFPAVVVMLAPRERLPAPVSVTAPTEVTAPASVIVPAAPVAVNATPAPEEIALLITAVPVPVSTLIAPAPVLVRVPLEINAPVLALLPTVNEAATVEILPPRVTLPLVLAPIEMLAVAPVVEIAAAEVTIAPDALAMVITPLA